jgi:hypothetical protein
MTAVVRGPPRLPLTGVFRLCVGLLQYGGGGQFDLWEGQRS